MECHGLDLTGLIGGRSDAAKSFFGKPTSPSATVAGAQAGELKRFQAKWIPVRVKKTRQNMNLELRFCFSRKRSSSSQAVVGVAIGQMLEQQAHRRRRCLAILDTDVPLPQRPGLVERTRHHTAAGHV